MPLTLTDEQVAALRAEREQAARDKQVRESVEGIWNDPELGDHAKALFKKKYPETKIEDYDLKSEIFGRLDREKAEAAKARQEAEEAAAVARLQAQKDQVKKDYGFTDDAMDRMEVEMRARRVYDYEAMAPFFASKEPKPIESYQSQNRWNHDRSELFKKIADDPEEYAFGEIVNTLREQERRSRS